MPDFSDVLISLARDLGADEAELKRLRRKMLIDAWVTAPLLAAGLLAWIYLFLWSAA